MLHFVSVRLHASCRSSSGGPSSRSGQVKTDLWKDTTVSEQVLSEQLGFPCNSFIPLTVPESSPCIILRWYGRPICDSNNSAPSSVRAKKNLYSETNSRSATQQICSPSNSKFTTIKGTTFWKFTDVSEACTASYVRFEAFTAVTMNNGVFWDVTPCCSCKNQRFGGT
jgi:hypothetical protein